MTEVTFLLGRIMVWHFELIQSVGSNMICSLLMSWHHYYGNFGNGSKFELILLLLVVSSTTISRIDGVSSYTLVNAFDLSARF